jgi:hypothetical protein
MFVKVHFDLKYETKAFPINSQWLIDNQYVALLLMIAGIAKEPP